MEQTLQRLRLRKLHRSLASWQAAAIGLLILAVLVNLGLYGLLLRQEEETARWQTKYHAVKAIEEDAVRAYGELLAEVDGMRESQAEEPQNPDYILDDIPLPADLQITLHDAAEEFGVDYYIMLALIEQESDYRNITGDGGDSIGYCQIQPKWWTSLMEEIGATDLTNPEDNFRAACAILAELTDKHGLEYALTAYNRGTPGESEYARAVMARAEVMANGHDQ